MKPWLRVLLLSIIDAALVAAAWFGAYLLRFDFAVPADYDTWDYASQAKSLAVAVAATHVALLHAFRAYGTRLRYAGIADLRAVLGAGAAQLVLWAVLNAVLERQAGFASLPLSPDGFEHVLRVPYGVLLVHAMLASLLTGGLRLAPRLFGAGAAPAQGPARRRACVVGAGDLAHQFLQALARTPEPGIDVLCLVAASPRHLGLRLAGVPAVALLEKLGEVIARERIEEVVIALDDAEAKDFRAVVDACREAKVRFAVMPSVRDVVGGRVGVSQLRNLQVEDLLGRPATPPALSDGGAYYAGKTVLVTGAGGSIGSELARQLAQLAPARLLLLGKGENSLLDSADAVRRAAPGLAVETIVCDVRDPAGLAEHFRRWRPQVVFHAAAHKHVPLMEAHACEAVRNNALGTASLAVVADRFGVERFVLLSTDKAVRPSSVMGAAKRLAEATVQSIGRGSKTVFQVVRFGNVLGTRGSVVPLFRRQIEEGGPVTVTHPDVERYFMTAEEAAHLVLQAAVHGKRQGLYLLDMGEPVKVAQLARQMIAMAGGVPDDTIKLEYTGLRPGEKLREELLTREEGAERTAVGKLWVAEAKDAPPWSEWQGVLEFFNEAAESGDPRRVLELFAQYVPEYHADPSHAALPAPPAPKGPAPAPAAPAEPSAEEQAPTAAPEAEEPETLGLQADLFAEPEPEAPPEPEPETAPAPETTPQEDAPVAQEEPLDESAALVEDEEVEAMPLVALLLADGLEEEAVAEEIAAWRGALREGDRLVVVSQAARPEGLEPAVGWLERGSRGTAQLAHMLVELSPGAQLGAFAGPGVRLLPGALDRMAHRLADVFDAVGVYSDHIGADGRRVELQDHEGCIHERFDFGGLLLYHLPAVREAGGIDTKLSYAWEYDLHLRLLMLGRFVRVAEPLYRRAAAKDEGGARGALYSPGLGPLGGFSYVFYPPEVEAEVTTVFEKALIARGAWLASPTEPAPYPEEREPVACSVVVPVLNRARFIRESVRSVLDGAFQDVEVVVVDNGSTDGTLEVLAELAAADARVRVLGGTGGSIASALNEGIRAARGRYICQLDSDDRYAPETLERMVRPFEENPNCGLAISFYRLMDVEGRVIEEVPPVTHAGYSRNQILRRDGAGAVRVFARCVLEEMGLYDEEHYGNFGEDYDMVLKIGERHDVVRVPEVLYFYRRHDDNTDVTRDPGMKYRNKNRARVEALRRRRAQNELRARQRVLDPETD
ncbi:MAG: polysaccharide biosynthesis protein [Candidatus Sumerlaeia bacterium]|nr:polysaccharide biosynthesis protein [Candidatus Sumerlaeia bacterium]